MDFIKFTPKHVISHSFFGLFFETKKSLIISKLRTNSFPSDLVNYKESHLIVLEYKNKLDFIQKIICG